MHGRTLHMRNTVFGLNDAELLVATKKLVQEERELTLKVNGTNLRGNKFS